MLYAVDNRCLLSVVCCLFLIVVPRCGCLLSVVVEVVCCWLFVLVRLSLACAVVCRLSVIVACVLFVVVVWCC